MRKIRQWYMVLLIFLVFWPCRQGMAAEISIDPLSGVIRPGQAVLISFHVPEEGTADLILRGEDGQTVSVVATDLKVKAGINGVWWNGTYNGFPAPEGENVLVLTQSGLSAETPVTIGPVVPLILSVQTEGTELSPGAPLNIEVNVSCAGTLTLMTGGHDGMAPVLKKEVVRGPQKITWAGENARDGVWNLFLVLTDHEGLSTETEGPSVTVTGFDAHALVRASADQSQYTPSYGSPYAGQDSELNYWTTPMDITDEETIWKMLMTPVTVVDTGKKNAQKSQVLIRAEPSEDAGSVGVVTCVTQGVHVLETLDNGWSLIECYSSSFHDSKIKAWNLLVQGYVQTELLKTVQPDPEIALIVDKLTQRLYIFKDGALFSTLLVSTGRANARQPYNETRSGEFLMTSKVGTFTSDDLYCGLAIRFNKGDLLHEVPYTLLADGTQNYRSTEPKLGTKASHGCIRVQRELTPERVNMEWLWKNLSRKPATKVIIWDEIGRELGYPEDDYPLYYNPKGGKQYHSSANCALVREKYLPLTAFTWGELEEEPYSRLTACPGCAPQLRREQIDTLNSKNTRK